MNYFKSLAVATLCFGLAGCADQLLQQNSATQSSERATNLGRQLPDGTLARNGLASSSLTSNALSSNGRYLVFSCDDPSLVNQDSNGCSDIFLFDTDLEQVRRVSVSSAGAQSNGPSQRASLSGNGRYVAFDSSASNLVADDSNARSDIFLKDLDTGAVRCISRPASGQSNGVSDQAVISNDGRFVVFRSSATNLVSNDTNRCNDIFLYEVAPSTLTRISENSGGIATNRACQNPSISPLGDVISFDSAATNLVGNSNQFSQVYLKQRVGGAISCVSKTPAGLPGNGNSYAPNLASTKLAFLSQASDLIADDINGVTDAFVCDHSGSTVVRVSTTTNGQQLDKSSTSCAVNDLNQAVFSTAAQTLSGSSDGLSQIYRKNLTDGTIVATSESGQGASDQATIALITARVAFHTQASNLSVEPDTNGTDDIVTNLDSIGKRASAPRPSVSLTKTAVLQGVSGQASEGLVQVGHSDLTAGLPTNAGNSFLGTLGIGRVPLPGYFNYFGTLGPSPGSYRLRVEARDSAGLSGANLADLNVNTQWNFNPSFTRLFSTGRPHSAAAGDIDGDGALDLAIPLEFGNGLALLRGNNLGSFSFAGGPSFNSNSLPNNPVQVATGKLNQDSFSDVAIANRTNLVQIRFGPNLATGATLNCEGVVETVQMADIDGDGDLDLIVAARTGSFWIYRNNGNAIFAPQRINHLGEVWHLQVVDFDRDGQLDVVTADGTANRATLWKGPNFNSPVMLQSGGVFAKAIAVGDFDGDGIPDDAVAWRDSNRITIVHRNLDGSSKSSKIYNSVSVPWALKSADLNGDGRDDLVVSELGGTRTQIIEGFDATASFIHPLPGTHIAASDSLIADLNNDGLLDVATAHNDGLDVYWASPRAFIQPLPDRPRRTVTLTSKYPGNYQWSVFTTNGSPGNQSSTQVGASSGLNYTFTSSGGGDFRATLTNLSNGATFTRDFRLEP
jgi:hypothetical protein